MAMYTDKMVAQGNNVSLFYYFERLFLVSNFQSLQDPKARRERKERYVGLIDRLID